MTNRPIFPVSVPYQLPHLWPSSRSRHLQANYPPYHQRRMGRPSPGPEAYPRPLFEGCPSLTENIPPSGLHPSPLFFRHTKRAPAPDALFAGVMCKMEKKMINLIRLSYSYTLSQQNVLMCHIFSFFELIVNFLCLRQCSLMKNPPGMYFRISDFIRNF